jgi:hypothetical protein
MQPVLHRPAGPEPGLPGPGHAGVPAVRRGHAVGAAVRLRLPQAMMTAARPRCSRWSAAAP